MSEWIALSRTQHADKFYWPRQGYHFAADHSAVPVLLAELTKVLPHYALGFTRQDENYQLVALTGLGGGRNLYLHPDGRWLASYVPSILRGYPFRMARTDNEQQVLAIEQNSLTDEPSAQPLFDQEGQLAERVQKTLDLFTQCDQNRQVTAAACQVLSQADVVEPWPLQLKHEEGLEPLKVQGLYRVSEQALNQLNVDGFAKLRSHGAMALAYAQLFSMGQLSQLTERARLQEKLHAQQQAGQSSAENIDSLLEGGDDELSFDFGD